LDISEPIYRLADLYGIQTAYHDISGQRHEASVETLLIVLRTLGVAVNSPGEAISVLREIVQYRCRQPLEPVTVVRETERPVIRLRLAASIAPGTLSGTLSFEDGQRQQFDFHGGDLPALETAEVEGTVYTTRSLPLPRELPAGYHRLSVKLPGTTASTLIISSPDKAYVPPNQRNCGVYLPLYALNSNSSCGAGDFADLAGLAAWLAANGGQVLATLPLLPVFYNESHDVSPYRPVSRRMWNELYISLAGIPELNLCAEAQAFLDSYGFQTETEAMRRLPLVDYRRLLKLKRPVLEALCRCLFAGPSNRLEALHRFAAANPAIESYARFRATLEKQGRPWSGWPGPLREGTLAPGDYDEETRRYYLYTQWLARDQMASLDKEAGDQGVQLYLDLPLGVHPDGFDIWQEPGVYARRASTGAPPDALFTRGQDWHFPPPHPEGSRRDGYRHYIACLRHHMRPGGMLRLDHVMGLHRLFWIPDGIEPGQGVYVRYPADELYAILKLESQRQRTVLVGEDLGLVPPEVRPAMARHGLRRLYITQYEVVSDGDRGLHPVPEDAVAALNTHDMFPFAAFWQGLDVIQRQKLGILDPAAAPAEVQTYRTIRETLAAFLRDKGWLAGDDNAEAVLRACLAFLASSAAGTVLVNLEDLWLETQPQNIPSTMDEYPNWRLKARYHLEEFDRIPRIADILHMIAGLRERKSP
jgi:4-alpha-glucanotransferase